MIEVIEYNDLKKRITCTDCGSVLEYNSGDEYVVKEYDHVIRYEVHKHYIICPVCHKHNKTKEIAYDCL